MTDTDKIVAAIFAAGICNGKPDVDPKTYIQRYDEFIDLLDQREKDKKKATSSMAKEAIRSARRKL
ncbi:MAG TPA: hypothetical protein VH684_31395 [Xanthobacteraceae bacterium]|jgi:hypothetical protein